MTKGRPRKNFFIPFVLIPTRPESNPLEVGDTITIVEHPFLQNYIVTKIHPRKSGVTARKVA